MHKLKTVEIDIEKGLFKINGKNVGRNFRLMQIRFFPYECVIYVETFTEIKEFLFSKNGKPKQKKIYKIARF